MKVIIWANKKDVMGGKINSCDYYTEDRLPVGKYIQITITVDEFTKLEDNKRYEKKIIKILLVYSLYSARTNR